MATGVIERGSSHSRQAMWALALALGAILAYVLYSYLGTFVLGLFVYYITRPVHRRLSKRVPTSSLAAIISLLTIALPILLIIGYTVAVGVSQLGSLVGPQQVDQVLGPLLSSTGAGGSGTPDAIVSQAISDPRTFASRFAGGGLTGAIEQGGAIALTVLGVLGTVFIQLFIVLTLAFYLLRDDERLAGWARTQILGEGSPADTYFSTVDRDLKTVFFGNILNAMAVAILAVISYVLLNFFAPSGVAIPSPVLVGLLVGIGSLIPVVGMKIVYIPVALIVAATALAGGTTAALWFPAVFLGISLFIVDTIPDLLLRPYVSGRDIHTGATIVAYIVGPLLFGWYGLFLGPLLLVAMIHFARIILPELAHGEPLTGSVTTEGPLDPTDEEETAPEPDPVDTNADAEPEPEAQSPPESNEGNRPDEGDRSPASDGGREGSASARRSSAERVRSTWEDSTTEDRGSNDGR